jgi:hypothetical protein
MIGIAAAVDVTLTAKTESTERLMLTAFPVAAY